jgi:hypothetical protein
VISSTHPEAFKLRPEIEAKTVDRDAPPVVIRLVPSDRPEEELRELASPRTNDDRHNLAGDLGTSRAVRSDRERSR